MEMLLKNNCKKYVKDQQRECSIEKEQKGIKTYKIFWDEIERATKCDERWWMQWSKCNDIPLIEHGYKSTYKFPQRDCFMVFYILHWYWAWWRTILEDHVPRIRITFCINYCHLGVKLATRWGHELMTLRCLLEQPLLVTIITSAECYIEILVVFEFYLGYYNCIPHFCNLVSVPASTGLLL